MRLAIEDTLITTETTVFDYGCGQGDDVRYLRERGISCGGWDPIFEPEIPRSRAMVVNLGYVVNVVEDPDERAGVLRQAWNLAEHALVVSARLTVDARNPCDSAFSDGFITRIHSFQKYYEQSELRAWIDTTLNCASVPAAPGVFYVFRDALQRESFVAARYRRRSAAPRLRKTEVLFQQHEALLQPLIQFLAARGRLPGDGELPEAGPLCQAVGSLRRAYAIIQRATGGHDWSRIRDDRAQDLLIYLALARFTGRPSFTRLPLDLRLDIRAFFSTYRHACTEADALLFSVGKLDHLEDAFRSSAVGKLMPSALYIHESAMPYLPAVIRVYEGCARSYIGAVEGANVIKLHRRSPSVSYLAYPDFERDAHPALLASLKVDLQTFHVQYRSYVGSKNPFILHRKEDFVHATHPLRSKFARLTAHEERQGLLNASHSIGTLDDWSDALRSRGLEIRGHRILRRRPLGETGLN